MKAKQKIPPHNSIANISDSKTPSRTSTTSVSNIRERLSHLLTDASDSALRDYAENKLHQSYENERLKIKDSCIYTSGPAVLMPPSSSSSSASSSPRHEEQFEQSIGLDSSTRHPPLTSDQKKCAELEKLQLSQRIRDVNNVLNGFIPFDVSLFSKSASRLKESSASPCCELRDNGDLGPQIDFSKEKSDLVTPIKPYPSTENTYSQFKRSLSALQKRLLTRKIQRKEHAIISKTWLSWRRGLQIQAQNRRLRMQQFTAIEKHRNQRQFHRIYYKWKQLTSIHKGIIMARIHGFTTRKRLRVSAKVLMAWLLLTLSARRKRVLLRNILMRSVTGNKRRSLRHWQLLAGTHAVRDEIKLDMAVAITAAHDIIGKMAVKQHHSKVSSYFFRFWRIRTQCTKRRRKLFALITSRICVNAKCFRFNRWKLQTSLERASKEESLKHQADIERKSLQQQDLYNEEIQRMQQRFDQILYEKDDMIAQCEEQLHRFQEFNARSQELEESVFQQTMQTLEDLLETQVARYDQHISRSGNTLENLMLLAEKNVLRSRHQAAQYLVNFLLNEKVSSGYEEIHLQKRILRQLRSTSPENEPPKDQTCDIVIANAPDNTQFLHTMLRQRLYRLYQLHEPMAQLAACSSENNLDAQKYAHAKYLADRIYSLQNKHTDTLIELHVCLCRLHHSVSSKI